MKHLFKPCFSFVTVQLLLCFCITFLHANKEQTSNILPESTLPASQNDEKKEEKAQPVLNKRVLLAILAKDKAHFLPTYLACISNLDYDKKLITVYINTNNNTDNTLEILENWAKTHQNEYNEIIFDSHTLADFPEAKPHEWSPERLQILGKIRQKSLLKTKEKNCDYYFVADCDNFILPHTLKDLVKQEKPIIAPFLLAFPAPGDPYTTFFAGVNDWGYYQHHDDYMKIFLRSQIGTFNVPLVHCTYLVDANVIDKLTYVDGTQDYEFVIFARSARNNKVDQYICNEQIYGTLFHIYKDQNLAEEVEEIKNVSIQKLLHSLQSPGKEDSWSKYLDNRIPLTNHRFSTLKLSLELMNERKPKICIETGTSRHGASNFIYDGGFTIICSDWAKDHQAQFYSVDIDIDALKRAKEAVEPNAATFVCQDSVKFLDQFPGTIDFLYLDSYDFDENNPIPSQEHHLKEIKAAYPKLTPKSIIVIDDCGLPKGGKGALAIPYLKDLGWKVFAEDYQVIMIKE